MRTSRQITLAILFAALLLAGGILSQHAARAAQSCTATLTWNRPSINKGDSATETWTVTGAAAAAGTCIDGLSLNSTHPVSFGPQSYTFTNVQSSITCNVVGVTNDGSTCTSGQQTVTVNSPTNPSTGSCNLFPRATGYSASTRLSFSAGNILSNIGGYDWGYFTGGIEEYLQSDNVSMTASGLPPGLTLGSETVTYPATNMANDGIDIAGYIAKDRTVGYPPLTRYHLAGAPTTVGTYNVTLTASSAKCGSQTQSYTIQVTPYVAQPAPYVNPPMPAAASSTNSKIQYVKTLFYNWGPVDGAQQLQSVDTWGRNGDKFVFVGEYGGSFAGLPLNVTAANPGGGLWIVSENGSKTVERDAAGDAGNVGGIYQHGHRHGGGFALEWGSGGFVLGNSSATSCESGGSSTGYCQKYGPGANRAVFYKQGGDGFPIVAGKSPAQGDTGNDLNVNFTVFKSLVVSQSDKEAFSLPRWTDLGSADTSAQGLAFGNNLINANGNNNGEVYSVASDGSSLTDTGTNVLDNGYTSFTSAWDWSGGFPPKLAVWERSPIGPVGATQAGSQIKVFRLASDGSVVLDKTLPAPTSTASVASQFAVWGNYVVTQSSSPSPFGVDVWKDGQKLDSVQIPFKENMFPMLNIAISKDGYMVVAITNVNDANISFLYKLNLPASGGANPGGGVSPGGGTTPVTRPPTGNDCVDKYGPACDQIQELTKQICALAPDLQMCSGQQF